MKNLFAIFSLIFILQGCSPKELADTPTTEVQAKTEDCETTKVADLEKEIAQKQDTAFDLTGSKGDTGCTLGK